MHAINTNHCRFVTLQLNEVAIEFDVSIEFLYQTTLIYFKPLQIEI